MKWRLARGLTAVLTGVTGAVLVVSGAASAAPPAGIVVVDGATQPVFSFADAVRETVRVSSGRDDDRDGRIDMITAVVTRPKETQTGLKVAAVMEPSPYWTVQPAATRRSEHLMEPMIRPDAHGEGWLNTYFVPRGYAVIEVELAGTGTSDGCLGVGGVQDQRSAAAVVEWLNGRNTATYADGRPAVASWSTGDVGIHGTSYRGTVAIQLAETGIQGLKTIVPVGAISSWYDYSRAQGIGYSRWSTDYHRRFAAKWANARSKSACAAHYDQMGKDELASNSDYTSFFVERNYRDRVDQVRASVLLVHGQADDNVKTTQFGRYWDHLAIHNVPRKLLLHNGGHIDLFSPSFPGIGPTMLGRWMDHWLYGVQNGIMNEPQAKILRSGATEVTENVWPVPDAKATTLHFGPAGNGGAGSLTTGQAQGRQELTSTDAVNEIMMIGEPGTVRDYRLAYLTPVLPSQQRLSGAGRVEVTFTSATTSTPLTALLVHYKNGMATTVVARGSLDAKNRASAATGTPLVPGQQAIGSILLEPKDYVFPAGSQIGVILTGNLYDYVHLDPDAGRVSVALGASRVVLPLAGSPISFPVPVPVPPTCTDAAWNATTIYNKPDTVSHNGRRWEAQWYTHNQEPGTTGPTGVWVDKGSC